MSRYDNQWRSAMQGLAACDRREARATSAHIARERAIENRIDRRRSSGSSSTSMRRSDSTS